MYKTIVLLMVGIFALCPVKVHGQDAVSEYQKQKKQQLQDYRDQKNRERQDYIEKKRKEFDEYRKKKNALFAAYLKKTWEPMPKEEPLPAPKKPDPVDPVVVPKDEKDPLPKQPVEVPKGDVQPVVVPKPEPPLEVPLPEPAPKPVAQTMKVDLFGMSLDVEMTAKQKFTLASLKEAEIGKVWDVLSGDEYTPMFEDCARYCQEMRLNGWATLQLCKGIGERLEGKGTNEAVVLQTYLMTQLGYDARLLRVGSNKLSMICPANVQLCQISRIFINGKQYYIWGESEGSLDTYKNNFDAATRSIDFDGGTQIRLNDELTTPRTFTSTWNSQASVSVGVSKCLMNYYKEMPLIQDWAFYARQPFDQNVSRQVMPVLRNVIEGKNTLEATNVLLHFVQTAFKYETDDKQFGREKTDFKEELFYYPASDCEDRSVLFTELVHTLLGLDVVLLHYPNHLCTAVKFNESIAGDVVDVDGQKYVICDPTYINSSVGNCMPKFKTVVPKIHKVFAGR